MLKSKKLVQINKEEHFVCQQVQPEIVVS